MKAIIWGAAVLLAASSAQAYQPDDLKAIGQGRGLYLRHCASCHGSDARGAGRLAAECPRAVPDLTAISSRDGAFNALHVQSQIKAVSGRSMPLWGRALASPGHVRGDGAAARDIYLLTRYLEYAQTPGVTMAGQPTAAPAAEGRPKGR